MSKPVLLVVGGAVFWMLLTLIFSVSGYIDASRLGQHQPYMAQFTETAIGFSYWGVMAPVLFAVTSSQRFVVGNMLQRTWLLALAGAIALIIMALFVWLVTAPLYEATFTEFIKRQRIVNWLGDMFLFVIALMGGYVAALVRERQQEALRAARLQSNLAQEKADRSAREASYLRSRLGSHFVMNALSNVLGLMRLGNVHQAEDATILLSDILRTMTSEEYENLVPLSVEIQSAEKYLAFQRIRYPSLESRFYIDTSTQDALVPNQLLQPLLENVFKHAALPEKIILEVRAMLEGEETEDRKLVLSVKNNSDSKIENITDIGEGLALTTQRLQTTMSANAHFERTYSGGWYQVNIVLPHVLDVDDIAEEETA